MISFPVHLRLQGDMGKLSYSFVSIFFLTTSDTVVAQSAFQTATLLNHAPGAASEANECSTRNSRHWDPYHRPQHLVFFRTLIDLIAQLLVMAVVLLLHPA